MKKYLGQIGLALISAVSLEANAAYVQSPNSEITFIAAYSRSGAAGDILIRISSPSPECSAGYYVSFDSPNKDSILSMALSAYHTKTKVRINGYDEPNWRGSSSNVTCEIEAIVFE